MKNNTQILIIIAGLTLLSSCGKKNIETKPIRKNITETVFATGTLLPEEQYNLTAQSEGYLLKLNFKEGDTVKTASVLAVIENKQYDFTAQSSNLLLSIANSNLLPNAPALKQAEANINAAKQKLKQDELLTERYKKLYESNSVSKLEYENILLALENSKANLASLRENFKLLKQQAEQQLITQKLQSEINSVLQGNNVIKAVIGGKIYKKYKQLGDYVRKGDVIAIIGSPTEFYAKLSIDETNISKIKLGQQVIVQFNINKEKNYTGIVTEIYPAFDEQTQSFYCKVCFNDDLDFKLSNTQLQANIIIAQKENVLVIPRNYLGYGNKVTTKDKGEVNVQTGFVSNEWVEILSGIDENITIITDNIQ